MRKTASDFFKQRNGEHNENCPGLFNPQKVFENKLIGAETNENGVRLEDVLFCWIVCMADTTDNKNSVDRCLSTSETDTLSEIEEVDVCKIKKRNVNSTFWGTTKVPLQLEGKMDQTGPKK